MCKLYLVISLFFISITSLYAQIEKEVSSFVDSTELLISNGRRLLIKSIENKDFDKIIDVYNYLSEISAKKECFAFTYIEELYINTLTSNWNKWISLATQNKNEIRNYCFSLNNQLDQILFKEIMENIDILLYNEENLTVEDRSVLEIYFYFLRTGLVDENYYQKIKDFRKEFPESRYSYFINYRLPKPKVKSSLSFSFGTNSVFTTNNLSKSFSPKLNFAMSLDCNVNKLYSSIYIVAGDWQIEEPFMAEVDGVNTLFSQVEYFYFTEAGLIGGYFLMRNNRFHLAPYVLLSASSLKSDVFDSSEDKEKDEIKIINTFTTGIGFHTEFKLIEWNVKNFYYYGDKEKSYVSLKLDFGYNYLMQSKNSIVSGNVIYIRPTIVWGFGNF